MTTTPPPEGTTEPRRPCGCTADAPGHLGRPSPPAPAAEDDAVAAYTVEERHWKRRAEAAEAEVERLREALAEAPYLSDLADTERERDEARQQVADLRAGIEALAATMPPTEAEREQVSASEDYWRGAEDAHGWWRAKVAALIEGGQRDEDECFCFEDAVMGCPAHDRPAPVVPDSTGLRALSTLYNAEDGSREKDAAYDTLARLLAVVGQGVTAEVPDDLATLPIGTVLRDDLTGALVVIQDRRYEQPVVTVWGASWHRDRLRVLHLGAVVRPDGQEGDR